ncbi:MAG: kinesin-like nuclear fusion protein [Thelocarpon superellum]|nr:MAG: kinesin-like nuclear fusion protein [Thelocarpon superellum]
MEAHQSGPMFRSSQLRQPSKIPPPGTALLEMSESAGNARAATMMPPPSDLIGRKHKGSALPEPTPKRKTLVERAGDTAGLNLPPPSSVRPASAAVRAATLAGVRGTPFSASVSARAPGMSGRQMPSSSFSASIGPGSRVSSKSTTSRPESASGQVHASQQRPMSLSRPASAMEGGAGDAETSMVGKRKGMKPFSSSFHGAVRTPSSCPRPRHKGHDHRAAHGLARSSSNSEASPSTAARALRDASRSKQRGVASRSISSPSKIAAPSTPSTPSHIPKLIAPASPPLLPSHPLTPCKTSKQTPLPKKLPFLTRDSNTQAWDTKGRLEDMEQAFFQLRDKMSDTTTERNGLEDTLEIYKARINELESTRTQLTVGTATLQTELDGTKRQLATATDTLNDERRKHSNEVGDLRRRLDDEAATAKQRAEDEIRRLDQIHREDLRDLERRLTAEMDDVQRRRSREIQELTDQQRLERQKTDMEMEQKARQSGALTTELQQAQEELRQERALVQSLRSNVSETTAQTVTLESSIRALKARIDFLESDNKSQAQCYTDMEERLQKALNTTHETKEKLRKEETLRRKLHNQVQELKGNIRVFCRVRPSLPSEPATESAKIALPDAERECKEVEVLGPEEKSSLGTISTKKNAFTFDRVFGPSSQNEAVFEEISQLVQSALDGYNVCIFCYGQTGSGKTHTMSAEDGMIPRAVHQIYDTAQSLEEKGWRYRMEGSFVEVYNENLNDLLGRPEEFDKKKHEIRHDTQKCKTHVSDLTTVMLDAPNKVESILRRAMANRSVAATKANERSSRGHSVFMLRLMGENHLTGERSEGTLNLVDLAGSERLSHSGSTGERLKETQNINRSLSCLGDVIGALGQGKEGGHVPYRNSKLTYLLQYSLGGNSKTLMFVMVSPLQAHLSETLTSLKFATKVHNTHIGTAKRQAKIRES